MQPSVLSIGNATNDSYLELKDDKKVFSDENDIFHFDLNFDDSSLEYEKSANVFGGVVVSDKIFRSAHLKSFSDINPQGYSNFSPENSEFNSVNRYIITHENASSILSANNRAMSWQDPKYVPGIIYVAENEFSDKYLSDFNDYLDKYSNVKTTFSLDDFADNIELAKKLLSRGELVFLNVDKFVDIAELDYTSADTLIESLFELGANNVVLFVGGQVLAANKTQTSQITVNFELNNFYQTSIFKAAYAAEIYSGSELPDALKLAAVISSESKYDEILKPLFAKQILTRNAEKYSVEMLRNQPNTAEKMRETAANLVIRPKGIFAADESGGNIHKKFEAIGIEDIAKNRRRYREMFFTTPDIQNYLSGVILFEETVTQSNSSGENFVDYLKGRGMYAGVKLDEGLTPLAGFSGETVTKGLDNLEDKLIDYSNRGIDFAKWRVAFDIDASTEDDRILPSNASIAANVQILARYARACQDYGIVPIVEPEVIFAGKHSLKECEVATKRILHSLFEELDLFGVDLSAALLKVNMVLSGKDNSHKSSPREVAESTAQVLRETVPESLAGVVFLSGGQTIHQATDNLQAITNVGPYPWGVTYSYARALQEPALKAWSGKDENVRQAQLVFLERVAANSHALYKN